MIIIAFYISYIVPIPLITCKTPNLKNRLINSAKTGSAKKTAQTAIDIYVKSDKAKNDIKTAFAGIELIKKYSGKKGIYREKREELSREFWAKQKKKKGLSTSKQLDDLIVRSLTKALPKVTERRKQK